MRCTRRHRPPFPLRLWYAVQWLPSRVSYGVGPHGRRPKGGKSEESMTAIDSRVISNKPKVAVKIGILAVVAIILVWMLNNFLHYVHTVHHVQAGVGLNALKMDVLQYADDHSGTLPPMTSMTAFRSAILPYAKSNEVFHAFDDATILFLPNPKLSGQKVLAVKKLTILLYESNPSKADGSRWVAFLPERAVSTPFGDPDFAGLKLVKEYEWQRLKRASGLLEGS